MWWVISAQNPMDQRLDDNENGRRHEALGAELVQGREVVCRGASGWVERSWAVVAAWAEVLAVARRWGQRAVFRVTAALVEVVMTSGGRDGEVAGWRDRALAGPIRGG